jgi:peptidoglycan biosynthesis protein MviN/MurJ (putative lipid II flippase)
MTMDKIWSWLGKAFSDEHGPSSSRIVSAWLSVSSMALIWWMVKHAMDATVDKLQVWVGGMPLIIGALATFAVSPYGVMKVTEMFKKGADKVVEHEEHKEDKVDDPDNK